MSSKPKIPAPPGPPSLDKGNAPASESETILRNGGDHPHRLKLALGKIMENKATSSQVESLLSRYFPHLRPQMPTCEMPPWKPHPRNPERSASAGNRWVVLQSHLSGAFMALSDAYAKDALYAKVSDKTVDSKLKALAVVQSAIAIMESRISTIERLAEAGVHTCIVRGSDSEGWYLLTPHEYRMIQEKEMAEATARANAAPELPAFEESPDLDENA